MRSKYSMFAEVELPAYLDPVANTARFDSPEFIHYLKESKRIPTQLPAGQTNSMTGRGVVEMFSESIREEGDTSLLLYSTVGMGEVGELMEEYDNVAGPYFLKSTQGNIPFPAARYPARPQDLLRSRSSPGTLSSSASLRWRPPPWRTCGSRREGST